MMRRLALTVLAALLTAACTLPIPIPIPSGAERKPLDVSAFSKIPRNQAEVDADVKACRKFATDSTSHDPDVAKKWFEELMESAKGFYGRETDQGRWNRYYGTCMKARHYEVN